MQALAVQSALAEESLLLQLASAASLMARPRPAVSETLCMSKPAKPDELYQRFLEVPQYQVSEIIQGRHVTQPRPAARHATAASLLGGELLGPFVHGRGGPGGWVILDEPELHLAEDILVPDLAGWRRERMPTIPAGNASRCCRGSHGPARSHRVGSRPAVDEITESGHLGEHYKLIGRE